MCANGSTLENSTQVDCRLVRTPSPTVCVDGDDLIQSTLSRISRSTSFPYRQRAAKLVLGFSDRIKPGKDSEEGFRQLAHEACTLVYAIVGQPTFDSVTDNRLSGLVRYEVIYHAFCLFGLLISCMPRTLEEIAALVEKAAEPSISEISDRAS